MVRGNRLDANGDIQFKTKIYNGPLDEFGNPLQAYRTIYGYSFAHGGHIFANTPDTLIQATRRITSVREPTIPGYEEAYQLRNRQVATHYAQFFDRPVYTDGMREHLDEFVPLPHSKRKLRISSHDKMLADGSIGLKVWTPEIAVKLKLDEMAKPKKYGRVICDCTTSGSLHGAMIAAECKKTMQMEPFVYKNGLFYAELYPNIEHILYLMTTWTAHIMWIAFSDDGYSRFDNTTKTPGDYKVDINTADVSSTRPLFIKFMAKIFKITEEYCDSLVGIIMAQWRLRNPWDYKDFIVLEPLDLVLPTGHPWTTLVHTCAQLLMFCCCVDFNSIDAIEFSGYACTVDRCLTFHDAQFLKMSPCLDINDEWVLTINLGVILRASGTCRGDLPGKGDIEERAKRFQSGIMNGFKTFGWHPCMNPLIPYPFEEAIVLTSSVYSQISIAPTTPPILSDDYFSRYNLNSAEIDAFKEGIAQSGFGTVLYLSAIDKIMAIDYGLPSVSY